MMIGDAYQPKQNKSSILTKTQLLFLCQHNLENNLLGHPVRSTYSDYFTYRLGVNHAVSEVGGAVVVGLAVSAARDDVLELVRGVGHEVLHQRRKSMRVQS